MIVLQNTMPVQILRGIHREPVEPVAFHFAKIVVVTSGWTNLTHGGQVFPLKTGDVALLPSGARVGAEPCSTVETVTLYLDPDYLRNQIALVKGISPIIALLCVAADGRGGIVTFRCASKRGLLLINHAKALSRAAGKGTTARLSLLGSSLSFLAMLGQPVAELTTSAPRAEVRCSIDAFRRDLARQWKVSDLVREVSLSPSQLVRSFNAAFGESPMSMLQRLRTEKFAELLLATDWSVQRCSAEVGWVGSGSASRMMRRFYGITPSQYRRSISPQRSVSQELSSPV